MVMVSVMSRSLTEGRRLGPRIVSMSDAATGAAGREGEVMHPSRTGVNLRDL